MKIKRILLLFLLLAFAKTYSQQNLYFYLKTAAQKNPELKAAFKNYLATLEKIPQVKSLPDPQLAFGYFIKPVETKTGPQKFKLSASQIFPWFGTLKTAGKVEVLQAKAAYEAFKQIKSRLFQDVRKNYYELYFIKRKIALTKANLNLLKRFQILAQRKITIGKTSVVDALRAQMALNQAQNMLEKLEDIRQVKQTEFLNLINADKALQINLPDTLTQSLLPDLKTLKKELRHNHLLIREDFLSRKFKTKQKWARKAGLPKFLIGLDYINIGKSSINKTGFNDALLIKAGITIPIFRKKYRALIKENELLMQVNLSTQKNIQNNLDTNLSVTYAAYEDALRRITLFKQQKKLALRATDLLQSQYENGSKIFEEILRMEQQYITYAIQYEKSLSDLQKRIAEIQFLIGKK